VCPALPRGEPPPAESDDRHQRPRVRVYLILRRASFVFPTELHPSTDTNEHDPTIESPRDDHGPLPKRAIPATRRIKRALFKGGRLRSGGSVAGRSLKFGPRRPCLRACCFRLSRTHDQKPQSLSHNLYFYLPSAASFIIRLRHHPPPPRACAGLRLHKTGRFDPTGLRLAKNLPGLEPQRASRTWRIFDDPRTFRLDRDKASAELDKSPTPPIRPARPPRPQDGLARGRNHPPTAIPRWSGSFRVCSAPHHPRPAMGLCGGAHP